jgi:hypothetical protein
MTFEQWLLTEEGKRCAQWPMVGPEYLRNRLWWAFHAGVEEGLAMGKQSETGAEHE